MGILKLKNIKFTTMKVLFLDHADINSVLVFNKISSGEKTINTLLVTLMMFIKLSQSI